MSRGDRVTVHYSFSPPIEAAVIEYGGLRDPFVDLVMAPDGKDGGTVEFFALAEMCEPGWASPL